MSWAMPLKIGLLALSRVVMGGRDMGRRFATTLITCGCRMPDACGRQCGIHIYSLIDGDGFKGIRQAT